MCCLSFTALKLAVLLKWDVNVYFPDAMATKYSRSVEQNR